MRISELLAVQVIHISFHWDRVDILLTKSKTDQLREGHIVMMAKRGIFYCPVIWLKTCLKVSSLIHQPESFLLCQFFKVKKGHSVSGLKPISYTRARESFLKFFEPLTNETGNNGFHSLRSGGASAAENSGATDREIRGGQQTHQETGTSRTRRQKDLQCQNLVNLHVKKKKKKQSLTFSFFFNLAYCLDGKYKRFPDISF